MVIILGYPLSSSLRLAFHRPAVLNGESDSTVEIRTAVGEFMQAEVNDAGNRTRLQGT
jgi:hypothetical protein